MDMTAPKLSKIQRLQRTHSIKLPIKTKLIRRNEHLDIHQRDKTYIVLFFFCPKSHSTFTHPCFGSLIVHFTTCSLLYHL